MSFSKSPIGVPKIGSLLRDWLPDSDSNGRGGHADVEAPQTESRSARVVPPATAESGPAKADSDMEKQRTALAEEAAMVLAAQKNPDSFGVLYERYVDRIYAYIYNRVGNAQDAEDLTARTFYKALSRLDSYEDRGYPFSAWLFRIAHNLVANWHRDHSTRRFLSLDRLWSHSRRDETLPEQHVEQEEKHGALWEAIDRLPDDRRDLLIYKFSSRLSNVEIGKIMNKSESAIKSLYFRTLAALRTDLEENNWER